ncbi:MAG: hypothetical protein N2315_00905 [Thermanaerothrix sp.]|nr:hypothetical protein [Thermanaerothrix sp.]
MGPDRLDQGDGGFAGKDQACAASEGALEVRGWRKGLDLRALEY